MANIKIFWVCDDLPHFQVKEVRAVRRLEHEGRVGPFRRAANRHHVFIGPYQACVGGHKGDLDRHLRPLAEGPQGIGDDLVDLVRGEFPPNAASHTPEGMLAGEDGNPEGF